MQSQSYREELKLEARSTTAASPALEHGLELLARLLLERWEATRTAEDISESTSTSESAEESLSTDHD
jgi:hypothetical protein